MEKKTRDRRRRGFGPTGLVTVGELIRRLQRFSRRTEVTFTEGLHSDAFAGCKRTGRGVLRIEVR